MQPTIRPPTIRIATPELARFIDLPPAHGTVDHLTDENYRPEAQPPISLRRDCLGISKWAQEYDGKPVVVVCQDRQRLSEATATWFRRRGVAAEEHEGGFEGWRRSCQRVARAGTLWVG